MRDGSPGSRLPFCQLLPKTITLYPPTIARSSRPSFANRLLTTAHISATKEAMRLAFLLVSLIAGAAATMAASDMLLNLPSGGDLLNLGQPTYDWGPRGPATLRWYYQWQHAVQTRDFDIGLTPEEIAFDMPPRVDRKEFESLPAQPAAALGLSEQRIVNYAMVRQLRARARLRMMRGLLTPRASS